MKKYDVIVVGGGLAGVCSAIACARQGCSVLIVEKSNCLGGCATVGLVTPFMPNSTEINGKKTELSQGIFSEILENLKKRDAIIWDSHFLEEDLKYILTEMMQKSGADILFGAYLSRVKRNEQNISTVAVATVEGEIELYADYYIDATGDGLLSYLAGCEFILGRNSDNLCQPMTLSFRLGNVDTDSFYAGLDELQAEYKRARERKELLNPRENILVFSTPTKNVLHFNTTRVVKKSPVSAFEKTEAEIEGRKQVFELYDFMKKHGKGLENSFLIMTAQEIGVRESRKILGEHILTERECIECTKFDDSIASCNYDIDIHNPEGTGTSHHYFKPGEYYTVPYRCLIPRGVDNLLVAGKCISADQGAQASLRIMSCVSAIGEACGTAMSIAVSCKVSTRDVDVKKLQKTLKNNGAFIGI